VLDNLKEGVLVPDIYDPALNPLYRDVLTHYGCVRFYRAGSKIQIEKEKLSAASDTPRTHPSRETLREPGRSASLSGSLGNQLRDTRIPRHHQTAKSPPCLPKKTVLLPLPLGTFRYYQHGQRVVHLDGCVESRGRLLRPPPRLDRTLGPSAVGRTLCSHPRSQTTVCCCGNMCARNAAGIASKKKTTRNTDRCVSLSYCGAPAAPALTSAHSATLFITNSANRASAASWRPRAGQEVRLGCSRGSLRGRPRIGVHEYRFVRRYLERGPQLTLRQVDPLIRELVQYRDLINLRTQEPKE